MTDLSPDGLMRRQRVRLELTVYVLEVYPRTLVVENEAGGRFTVDRQGLTVKDVS